MNILGDSLTFSTGRRRILYNAIDILLNVASLIYCFAPCYTERSCRIIGGMIVLLKFIRAYRVLNYSFSIHSLACYLSKEYSI